MDGEFAVELRDVVKRFGAVTAVNHVSLQIRMVNSFLSLAQVAAKQDLDEEFLNDPTVYAPPEVVERLQFIEPVGEAESLYQRLWDEVKSAPVP
jgi:hypothetical protein